VNKGFQDEYLEIGNKCIQNTPFAEKSALKSDRLARRLNKSKALITSRMGFVRRKIRGQSGTV
jgi:hypothetical protein